MLKNELLNKTNRYTCIRVLTPIINYSIFNLYQLFKNKYEENQQI